MKINPTFTKYCDGCDKADLELEEATSYNFHDLSEGKHWFVRCKHEDACIRIASIIEGEKINKAFGGNDEKNNG